MALTNIAIFVVLSCAVVQGGAVSKESRVLGGENAKKGEFPFVVALSSPNYKTDLSTATILTHNWLLTDGWTCFLIGSDIQAIVGTVTLNQGGRVYQVASHIKHPDWQESDDAGLVHPNDICLVKLKEFIPYSENVTQVTLPPPDYEFPQATPATVPGWGTTTDDYHDVSNRLKVIRNMKVYQSSCPDGRLGGSYPFVGQICASSGKNGVTPCSRDEGSPLVYNSTIQIGVLSYYIPGGPGVPCSGSAASAYSKVSHYVPWIVAALGDEAKNLKIASLDDLPEN